MDSYQDIRAMPLRAVLASLGHTEFRKRPNKDEWYGKCIFHNPEKNNTSFSFTDRIFFCFSCGVKGSGSIDLLMAYKKVGFKQAVEELRGMTLTVLKDEVTPSQNKPFLGNYAKYYQPCPWLEARVPKDILDLYGVGFYNNPARKSAYAGKVLLPIFRFADGEKVGYLARTIEPKDGEPKYLLPTGLHKQLELWGAFQLKGLELPLPLGFVVESPFAVMKLRALGYLAVSPFGVYLSSEQVDILALLFERVVYLPDRDKYAPALQALGQSSGLTSRLWVKAPPLPEGVDDPEYLSEEQLVKLIR